MGQRGEIVVRGPNIISGYENNPEANKKTFVDGWFRTGDIGHLDEDQYLYITGRIKEMINRGGQKIAPLEVDEVLKAHPEVSEAVSFTVPHPTLGEDIAAAIILHKDARSTSIDIRRFAAARLAPFKVPSQIVIVDQIPTGPTGKLQRINLMHELADQLNTEFVLPRNWVEKQITAIWSEVLQIEEGALYPALHRLRRDGLLTSEWGVSENNRRAKFSSLTAAGRDRLERETELWLRHTGAVRQLLEVDGG